ncbi:MAG: AbrB/MazE/SpoVT family DNA-binding domain-containing protein [Proteobacteria bacterium]|nr:AbrB/MazE/SpoVT family DNA-binding domain-containing protein [Pseudomonadota bacterium]
MGETTKLRKVGNSSAISLPKAVVDALQLHLGEELQLTVRGDCLIVRKVQFLKDLLATVPPSAARQDGSPEWREPGATGRDVIDDE